MGKQCSPYRKDRLCLVRSSAQDVEDKHHFLFDRPAYSSIRASHANLFSVLVQYLAFLTVVKQMHVVDSLGTVFP